MNFNIMRGLGMIITLIGGIMYAVKIYKNDDNRLSSPLKNGITYMYIGITIILLSFILNE